MVCFLGKGSLSSYHQKSASCRMTARCVDLRPRRCWARKSRDGRMQKPTAITSTPHFFSERSLASRADLTTGGGGTDAEGGKGTTLALSVAGSFLLIV